MHTTRLLNALAQRVVDLQAEKQLQFPSLRKDFNDAQIKDLLTQLLGFDVTVLTVDLTEVLDENDELKKENDSLRQEINSLQDEVEGLEKENDSLRADIDLR